MAAVLAELPHVTSGLVFAGVRGKPLSDMRLAVRALPSWRRLEGVPEDVAEQIIGHRVGSAVRLAYALDDLMDQRCEVQERVAAYLGGW